MTALGARVVKDSCISRHLSCWSDVTAGQVEPSGSGHGEAWQRSEYSLSIREDAVGVLSSW